MHITTALSGVYDIGLPSWGRCFWQDPNDGVLFLAYASGNQEVDFIYSSDSGVTWSDPALMFKIDPFDQYNNYDTFMDTDGNIHAGFALNGSGCYQYFPKTGSSWSAGAIVKPIDNYWTTGKTAGWNGTITRIDFSSSYSTPFIYVANKNSEGKITIARVDSGYTGDMNIDFITSEEFDDNSGYPMWTYDNIFTEVSFAAISGANIFKYWDFFGWSLYTSYLTGNGFKLYNNSLSYGNGTDGAMALCSTPSGAELWSMTRSLYEQEWRPVSSGYMEGSAAWRGAFKNTSYNSTTSGTHVDFTYTDVPGTHMLYFQDTDDYGSVCIKRILCNYYSPSLSQANAIYSFSDLTHSVSGVKSVAPVDRHTSGGVSNIGYWKKFKAVKHPVSPGTIPNENHYKGEFLVTLSNPPIIESGNALNIFNIGESPSLTPGAFKLPNTYRDYAEDLMVNVIDSGGFSNGWAIFDGRTTSAATLAATGGYINIEFDRPLHINKIHFAKQFNRSWGKVSVSGSFDNENWNKVSNDDYSLSVSELGYLTTDDRDDDAFGYLNSPVCKFLRLKWSGSQSCTISHIRIYGKGSTRNTEMTNPSFATFQITNNEIRKERSRTTERFVYQQDTVPPGFETYGNVAWKVKASGAFAATNFLPGAPAMPDGRIPSGTYAGDTYGHGDGFSVQNEITSVSGASGVFQYSVYVDEPRRISFYKKTDLHPQDKLEFFVVSPGGVGSGTLYSQDVGTNSDWSQVVTPTLSIGRHVLKWVYRRGGTTDSGVYGAAWIDDVVGLDVPQPSMYSWLRGAAFDGSGSINAYINASAQSQINAFMSGAPLTATINAYLPSAVFSDAISSVNAYMMGKGISINAYLLGGTDIVTYPTGSIYGYVETGAGNTNSSIVGFLAGTHASIIHGYMKGRDTSAILSTSGDFSTYGYLLAQKPYESIHAIVNSPSGTPTSNRNAYLDAHFGIGDQIINAYMLVPSGSIDSRNAYTQGWDGGPNYFSGPQSMVYAYMAGPIGSGTATIHSYMLAKKPFEAIHGYMGPSTDGGGAIAGGPGGGGSSTSGVIAGQNWMNAYMKGYAGFQTIYAYLHRPPASNMSTYAYLSAGQGNDTIWGYLEGKDIGSGIINAYMSGVGFADSTIYARLFGASGLTNSEINSFLTGHSEHSAIIWGSIQGMPGSGDTSCRFFGLVPEKPATIPTNTYPGMLF